jgi:hypothetical protein
MTGPPNLGIVWRCFFGEKLLSDPFADIRPYRDQELAAVLQNLLHSTEFLDVVCQWKFGAFARLFPGLCRFFLGFSLRRQSRHIVTVRDMQLVIEAYMDRMINQSSDGFSYSGLADLPSEKACLYMSNHRDIAMDPAFTNYALHRHGRDTCRIAIGDNLLTKPWVADLMRLNKSFIVKRSLSGPRQLLAASKNLSQYIEHSLQQEGESIWLAQREGRAKDGLDKTEPAIIKMLALGRNKGECTFAEYIAKLAIVPVAISYELDPCDALKAAELYQRESSGSYEKGEQEDLASIGRGIAGEKGCVHVSFGTLLPEHLDTPAAVAEQIDRQVTSLYCLHPTNLYAYKMLHGEDVVIPKDIYLEQGQCSRAEFEARIQAMPSEHQPYALAIYANVLTSKLKQADNLC